jgi:hypothetical protein
LIDELQLHGQISPEEFIKQREAQLDKLFPTAELMPGGSVGCGKGVGERSASIALGSAVELSSAVQQRLEWFSKCGAITGAKQQATALWLFGCRSAVTANYNTRCRALAALSKCYCSPHTSA